MESSSDFFRSRGEQPSLLVAEHVIERALPLHPEPGVLPDDLLLIPPGRAPLPRKDLAEVQPTELIVRTILAGSIQRLPCNRTHLWRSGGQERMKTSSIILLGLGVSIALVLSAGAVYGMTGQAASQRVSASVEMMSSSMMSSSMNGGGNNNGNNNNGSISPADTVLTAIVSVVILSAGGVALAKRRRLNLS